MSSFILSSKQVYEVEKNIKPSFDLMNNAGKLSAKYINKNLPKKNILVLCGTGGNGGDGFITGNELKKYKWNVTISIIGDIEKITGDSLKAYKKLKIKNTNFNDINLDNIDYVIDAIFGIGLNRNLDNEYIKTIEKINNKKLPVIALDIPSGVNSDNGTISNATFNCFLTLTYSAYKLGHYLLPSAEKCGKIVLLDIGIPKPLIKNTKPVINLNSPSIWKDKIVWPKVNDHKYSRGCIVIIGGPKEMTGAARLAAKAAQRAGSGIVILACDKNSSDIYYRTLTSQIVKSYRNIPELKNIIKDKRINSVVIGPGLGINNKNVVKNVLKHSNNIIIDADAITCFQNDIKSFKDLIRNKTVILTPHEGEFKKLFPNIKGNLVDKAIYAAKKLNSIIVLKSANTIIASQNNHVILNKYGSRWLATAGSGDVLAGIIGALLSNGMDAFHAAAFGVWIHSSAGIYFGPGLIAEDISDLIPKIYKKIY